MRKWTIAALLAALPASASALALKTEQIQAELAMDAPAYETELAYAAQEMAASGSIFAVPAEYLLILAVVALIIAFVVVIALRAQLKTAAHRSSAAEYVKPGSFNLHVDEDHFLYRRVEKRLIETQNNDKKA